MNASLLRKILLRQAHLFAGAPYCSTESVGAKSVVGALWEVDDSATRSLMKNFYSHLAQGQDKASALRQAKLDYLRTSPNRSPALWAPFTLIGDGSAPIIF